MGSCNQEMCPMWDGDTCPCRTFGLEPDSPPTDGVFSVEAAGMSEMTVWNTINGRKYK